MKNLLPLLLLSLLACNQTNNAQSKKHTQLGESYAKEQLALALSDSAQHNVIDHKQPVIKDQATAASVAEAVLFSLYGEENIISQRPYEAHYINSYWVLMGTLPEDTHGGTFIIIIDAMDGRIIKISHGK